MLGQEQSLGSDDLHHVDPAVAKTFVQLQEVLQQKKHIETDKSHVSDISVVYLIFILRR